MKIGIIGAMEQEVAILKAAISDITEVNKGGCTFFSGQINGVDVVLLQSGIGKVAAAVGTSILLSEYQPDVVLNTGSAGGFDSTLNLAMWLSQLKFVTTMPMLQLSVTKSAKWQVNLQRSKRTTN